MGRGDLTGKLSKAKSKGPVISFDEGARKTFLTGFRKRKNDRRQFARQKIAEQVRQEKLTARQERRVMQKEALSMHDSDDEDGDGSDAEPAGAEVATYVSGDALVTTVVEALLPDEEEEEEEEEKLGRVGGASYTAPKKLKKFNLSQPLSQAIPGYKPKVRACTGPGTSLHASARRCASCLHGFSARLFARPVRTAHAGLDGPAETLCTNPRHRCNPLHPLHPLHPPQVLASGGGGGKKVKKKKHKVLSKSQKAGRRHQGRT